MTFQRLTSIVRSRYETGAYASASFHMARGTFDRLKKLAPPPTSTPPGQPFPLLDIPIVFDDELPIGRWELFVDIGHGSRAPIESGELDSSDATLGET